MTQRTLLLVTADPKLARQLDELTRGQFHVTVAAPGVAAEQYLRSKAPLEVLLADHAPGAAVADTVRLLARAQELRPDVRRGMLTGYGDIGAIIRAVHNESAQFVLHRPIVPAELLAALAVVPHAHTPSASRPTTAAA